MKLTFTVVGLVTADGGCYWATGNTGAFLECLPDHYIKVFTVELQTTNLKDTNFG